jgi:hypothetical protein
VRRRARLGGLAFAATAVALAGLTVGGFPIGWTLGLAPLLWLAGLGVFQARAKT